jgi:predicted nucleic acid-binding protein
MADLILDTNVLGEFFDQFFDGSGANRGNGEFTSGRYLSLAAAREINRITRSYFRNGDLFGGVVIISSFGLVELFRKWPQISAGKIELAKMQAFISQPPEWLGITPVDESLAPAFLDVPTHVYTIGGFSSVDWTDAIHIATALARGDGHKIATTDEVMHNLNLPSRVACL